MSALQQIHVRVNDAATGKPTPCRVRFTDAEGTYYAPHGRLTEFATAYGVDVGGNVIAHGKKYAYIDGSCEIALPPGKIIIEVHKGFEYKPLHLEHDLIPGKLSLRLTLERMVNLREEGWYSGDTRCHFLTPHAALLEGMAEDLAVINLLAMACQTPETDEADDRVVSHPWAIPNLLAFSGQQPALEAPGHMVVVNTLNWHPRLGRLGLLNCHRVVYPLHFGAPGYDDWTLSDWCDQCHRKGGLVVWTESKRCLGEALADAILGKIDALEISNSDWDEVRCNHPIAWLTDWGITMPVVGGSGKVSNAQVVGNPRTYARLKPSEPFSYRAWIEAVRAGRSFVTKGPLLRMTVNGHDPGAVMEVPAANPTVHVKVDCRSASAFHRIELTYPGGMIATQANDLLHTVTIDETIRLQGSGSMVARCCPAEGKGEVTAFTSPFSIRLEGQSVHPRKIGDGVLEKELQNSVARLAQEGRFANDSQRQRLVGVFEQALQQLARISPA